jgi:diguanylate cyclase
MSLNLDQTKHCAGTLLFVEGDVGSVAYIIASGSVEIFLTRDDERILLATRGPGEIIGEMALIDQGPRSASALVTVDCELVPITAEQLQHRISKTDPILRMCLSVAIARCREMAQIIENGGSRPRPPETAPPARGFAAAIGTLALESELRRAIQEGQLELFYQPIVRLPTRRLAGFEALARWHHPTRGLIPAAAFVPIAEASGLIADLTSWCLSQVAQALPAITVAAVVNRHEVDRLFMSVNVSGQDLERPSFLGSLAEMLRTSGIAPDSIKLEVTESALMTNPERAIAALDGCRRLGVSVAIDDFGTGYSSLSYLSTLPITTIKIDRSFISTMVSQQSSRKITDMVLGLADKLAVPVIAEGVESQREERMLVLMGCDLAQGYLYGRPAPLSETLKITSQWRHEKEFGCRGLTLQ